MGRDRLRGVAVNENGLLLSKKPVKLLD